jgi:ribosome-associated toxin RatA of RatAB toxin-antitoxin module
MKYFFVNIFLFGLLFLPVKILAQTSKWELKKEEDGITVYTREVAGTDIKEFKASTKLSSPIEKIYRVLLDVDNYPAWIEDVVNARKIFQAGDSLGMYYQLNLPWPMKDRDLAMVTHIKNNEDSSILLQIVGTSKLVAENDDFIRIKEAKGQWLISPLTGDETEVTYRFLADPEGFLPAWVINIFIIDGPFKTLENLEEYARKKTF